MKKAKKDSKLSVVGELTIYTAADQKEKLVALVTNHPLSTLDLSGVTEVDGAGLQLLILSKLEAGRVGHQIEFINHSDAVIETIELCNLSGLFDDPVILSESAKARA
ncbi:MAG: STAS domain-containing protein [Pseudohongiella sp.]|nr:STAS domain-containing protein [Pseudohongiella sp.]